MNWQHIIDNGKIVYKSQEADTTFRNWALKVTRCNVSYYEIFPLDDIDKIICSVLQEHDGTMEEYELATILGFNVKDNFDVSPKRYADVAELQLFRAIIKPVFDWGLVSKNGEKGMPIIFSLTELGKRAIERKEKYKFFNGHKDLFENSGINAVSLEDNTFFPFYTELNISSEITNPTEINYTNIDIQIFDSQENELIHSIQLQSEHHYNIFQAEKTNYFNFESKKVDIRLYSLENTYYSIIFLNNTVCSLASDLLNNDANSALRDKKIEWGLYLRLMDDESAILDYKTISPFEDIIELDDLIKDRRLCWNDDELFSFIFKNADADQISLLSNYCPIDIIKKHIADDGTSWDWVALSKRIDGEFILNNPLYKEDKELKTKLSPWNYEIISSREDVDIETIKSLLQKPDLNDVEWNWDIIMPQLDFNFIKNHIDEVDFDLMELTKEETESVKQLIRNFPSKRWDYQYISENYDLDFILENIQKFSFYSDETVFSRLNLKTILNRAFSSVDYSEKYCKSTDLRAVISLCKDSLSDYTANTSDYVWSSALISFLEDEGFLTWPSGHFIDGFECNSHVKWTEEYFRQYNSKVTTAKGFSFVSKSIESPEIIIDNQNFNWDWNTISVNEKLISNDGFVHQFIGKLNLHQLLSILKADLIESLFETNCLLDLLDGNVALWTIVTGKVSIEFVRRHLNYSWDWSILTQRFYTTININALGNERWIDKWDWKFLTQNLDWDVVFENLDNYQDYWDWEFLTNKIDKDFILNNLPDYVSLWDWNNLLESRLDKLDLSLSSHLVTIATCLSVFEEEKQSNLWSIITRKFSTKELSQLINSTNQLGINSVLFKWDYEYFYSLADFDVRQYIDDYMDDINWDLLSKSPQLNKTLLWDSELYGFHRWVNNTKQLLENKDYDWNFEALSQLDSINSYAEILSIRTAEWDWVYLTQNSKAFDEGKFFNKNFKLFKNYIDFQALSERQNSGVTQKTIEITIDKNWDWTALSQNTSIEFDIKFIKDRSIKPWDWQVLSKRNDIVINNEFLFELVDKDWDWQIISTRQDIVFDEDCIRKLYDKPLDWFVVSQNNSFIPNQTTLSFLKAQRLDWEAISQNAKLDTSVLWDYKDILNWKLVTKNKIDCGDLQQLEKYQEYIDWQVVSASDNFVLSIDNLNRFKHLLQWRIINQRSDLVINNKTLESFADVIDWNKASASRNIIFTEELIEQYRSKWNWQILKQNPSIIEKLDSVLSKYKTEVNCVSFLERFPQKPYVYHFTHLFNAVEIIKNRKILSRNKAEGKFANAAANIVERRSTAHKYARFYYRPQTPTQFYNECLGWDSMLQTSRGRSYYPQALNMGLPKCPMPVFFKFDLSEVVSLMADKCYYSTGNMQTNRARVIKITEEPNGLNTNGVYSTIEAGVDYYKEYSQQEFLVLDEFDFSNLHSFEIICYDEEQAEILKSQLDGDDIVEKITSNSNGIFHRNNREILFYENGNTISVSSNYKGNAHFEIKCQDKNAIHNAKVIKETSDMVFAYPSLEIAKSNVPIEIHFVDEKNRKWVIYSNLANPSTKSAKFILSETVSKATDSFAKEMERLPIQLSKDLFYPHMVNSYHGIAHTTRVLFATYLLCNTIDILDQEKKACYIAAIIHDLGKRSDREGAEHGLNSMELYKEKIKSLIDDAELQSRTLNAVRYHSVEDKDCPNDVCQDIIWKVLKDSDALDRSRFGGRGCDKSYLRLGLYQTDVGQNIIDLTSYLPGWSEALDWEHPYEGLIEQIHKYAE